MAASGRARVFVPTVELHLLTCILDVLLRERSSKDRERALKDITALVEFFADQGCVLRLHSDAEELEVKAVMTEARAPWQGMKAFLSRPI